MKHILTKISAAFVSLVMLASCGVEAPVPGQVTATDNVKGNIQSPIVITEYSDFQCPACRVYFYLIQDAWEDIKDDVIFVYRHFPLQTIHPYALTASIYSEAAGKQNKFWEMHDIMFANQADWSAGGAVEEFTKYAEALGLDMEQFAADVDAAEVKQKVRVDIASANKQKVNSTPTFYINGDKVQFRTPEELIALIEAYKSQ